MNFNDWLSSVPKAFIGDPLWSVEAYRLAMFSADVGWRDATKLTKDLRTRAMSSQLYDALGSIGANIAEGYSRLSGKDQARFYEYALGSARESRSRYFNARHLLGETVTDHRFDLLASIIKLLLVMVPDQRTVRMKEESVPYMGSTSGVTLPPAFLEQPVPFD
jgi:four helix bundle protein